MVGSAASNQKRALPRSRPLSDRSAGRIVTLASFAALLLSWEAGVRFFGIHPLLLPPPSLIGAEFIEISERGLLWAPLLETLQALGAGLLAALLVGVPAGILIGAIRTLDLLSTPYLWALQATPNIAIAPLLVIWIGFGFDAKVWMVFLSASVMILLITLEGVKTVDDSLVRVARSYGASRRDIFLKVVFPYILPVIANAVRNGIGAGIVAVMVVEMFSASGGIGAQVIRASHSYDGPRLFAFIIVLVTVSLVLIVLSRRVEAHVSRWREEVRA
jgi:NitT/TauT family transport system permease protein